MIYPICEGHNDCIDKRDCFSETSIKKGTCDCSYKASCHLPRQKVQTEFRKSYGDKLEDCDAYKLLKPMYNKREEFKDSAEELRKLLSNQPKIFADLITEE
jgi:hypothetical protein